MSRMLTFDLEGERFMYRVAGVAVIDGRVLLRQFEGEDDFYVVPGGRVEMREPGRRGAGQGLLSLIHI